MTPDRNPAASYKQDAQRRSVNLSLNSDLLARIKDFTPDLSATVETLLGDYLTMERRRRDDDRHALNEVIDGVNVLHRRRGFLSDEFSSL